MKAIAKIWHKQAGMAPLQLMLLLMMIGALVFPVILSLMNTGARVGMMEECKTKGFFAADAGITAALWRIKTNYKLDWLNSLSGRWNETIYAHDPAFENYTLPLAPNGNSVNYTLAPKWVLEGLETPDGTQTRNPAEYVDIYGGDDGLATDGHSKYKITIYYEGTHGALGISRVGCWLPMGLEYVGGPSSVEDNVTNPLRPYLVGGHPTIESFRGGQAIKWTFSTPVDFYLFPPAGAWKEIKFEYAAPNGDKSGKFCWLRSNMIDNYLAWSALNVFEVKSTANSPCGQTTRATSYSIRNVGDPIGAAIEGDYAAFGNTLMRDDSDATQINRDRVYKQTKSTVMVIPANSQVERIFLFWTGWKCKPWNGMTSASVAALPAAKKVNKVWVTCNTTVGGPTFSENITASLTQAMINRSGSSQHGWSYSCFADITDRVKDYFNSQGVNFVGNGTYTVSHADVRPGVTMPSTGGPWYPVNNFNYADNTRPYLGEPVVGWTTYLLGSRLDGNQFNTDNTTTYNENSGGQDSWAYSAWSIVVVYTNPLTLGHTVIPFTEFVYGDENSNMSITKSGFLVPALTDETNAARITCFVAEGDDAYSGDSIAVNGTVLPGDTTYPADDVWNSKSLVDGRPITGIDIDTWNLSKTIVKPGDTSATVRLPTGTDSWSLVYIFFSFRSLVTGGGSFIYDIQ